MHTPSEQFPADYLITPQDVATAGEILPYQYYSMANYPIGQVVCQAQLTATKTAIFALMEATSAAGGSAAAVSGKTVTLTGSDGTIPSIGVIDFNVNDLTDDQTTYFVGAKCTTNENGDDISACLLRLGGRHKGSSTQLQS